MDYISSMFIGPLRIVLFVFFIYVIKQLISFKDSNQRGLDYFIARFVMFISVIMLVSMLLTQLNAFDLLVCLSVLAGFMILVFLNLNSKKNFTHQFLKMRKRLIIYTVRNFEKEKKLVSKYNLKKRIDSTKTEQERLTAIDLKWQIGLAVFIALLCFASRYYFFNFDTFTLSDIWYSDLHKIKDLTNQHWFFHEGSMMGEYLIMNVYGELTGITDTIALASFGLLESSLLAVILFWFTYKLTSKKLVPALIAALSFTLLYPLLPLNINLITQHKSIFFALILGLPAIMYNIKPTSLRKNTSTYLRWMSYLYAAIIFTDLFVALFIVFPFVLLISILNLKRNKRYLYRSLLAYLIALSFTFLIHLIAAWVLNYDLIQFINSNLYNYTSYTYLPQLILPFDQLLNYYQWASLACVVVAIPLYLKYPKKYNGALAIAIFLSIFLQAYKIEYLIVDEDLLNITAAVFIPLLFGISLFLFVGILELFSLNFKWNFSFEAILSTIVICSLFIWIGKAETEKIPFKKNETKEPIMEAYDKLNSKHLPYSYAVVNTQNNSVISEDSHYFINYNYFNKNYIKKDSIYNSFRNVQDYFKRNPDAVLPKSTFVFLYENEASLGKKTKLNPNIQDRAKKNIDILKSKGRRVNVFYQGSLVKVYEIVNVPKQSKIKELLF
ncbi:hypothetical protein [Mesonia aquimarina]|uniref:hypothetical protein n=1 Tax=Mesonia aquimarina TaxID=1504967 RepID=UPI000EF5EFCA|nr:hypothetical protein [Mesonia aquimarina]